MNRRLASVLSAAAMFAAAAVTAPQEAGAVASLMPSPGCGFVPLPQPVGELTARYFHCDDSFILIKFHWSGGNTGTACVAPWHQHPFYRSDGQRVVNAYYVKTPPNVIGPPGSQMCSVSQPRV
ncbi:DUF6355 family natural product biosynthesis protein [Lentzea sp. NPDC003310]|uniref:DUF6355 family natural product biosynthesis protein n=1 Tax=Lentzea sp. NPDC003310 TaxID=3154447 RepID=UPI0033B7DF70